MNAARMPSECGDASPASGPDVTAPGDFPDPIDLGQPDYTDESYAREQFAPEDET